MEFPNARVVVGADTSEVDALFADAVIASLERRSAKSDRVHIAISGGSLAERALPRVIEVGNSRDLDWSKVHVWFADERFVDRGQPERNATTIVDAFREADGFRADHLYIPAAADSGMSLDDSAAAYAELLRREIGFSGRSRAPGLDLVLLGMGPDGHTASLFPGREHTQNDETWVIPVSDSPKPPAERFSLTFAVLAASSQAFVYATGASKREALARALAGEHDAAISPIGAITAREEIVVFADQAAFDGER